MVHLENSLTTLTLRCFILINLEYFNLSYFNTSLEIRTVLYRDSMSCYLSEVVFDDMIIWFRLALQINCKASLFTSYNSCKFDRH